MRHLTQTPGGAFVAYNATVVGDVAIGAGSSIWFNSIVRGDVAPIRIGQRVNVQDAAILHCDTGVTLVVEDDASIAHGAIVHGEFVGRGALVGIGARLLAHSRIGSESLIAAGAVVPPGLVVPDRMLVMGIPAKIVRPLKDEELEYLRWVPKRYLELAQRYMAGEFDHEPAPNQGTNVPRSP